MPRAARFDAPGAIQHVTVRGIERRVIFRDDADREDFVSRLDRILPEEGASCFAWALMPNHVHLLLRTGGSPLSRVMARLGTGYSLGFNRRYERSGHLFQNRYHSICVQDDPYFGVAIRYIHLNPVRSGLVTDVSALARFAWTGHSVLMGLRRARFQEVASVLRLFGNNPRAARLALDRWMRQEPPPDSRASAVDLERHLDLPPLDAVAPTHDLADPAPAHLVRPELEADLVERLVQHVCDRFRLEVDDLGSRRKHRALSRARAVIAYVACHRFGVRGMTLAAACSLSAPAISRAAARVGESRDLRRVAAQAEVALRRELARRSKDVKK